MIPHKLRWWRCPDGAELVGEGGVPAAAGVSGKIDPAQPAASWSYIRATVQPLFIRMKSGRREEYTFEGGNYRDSPLLRFATAADNSRLLEFVSAYGLPALSGRSQFAEGRRLASTDPTAFLDDPHPPAQFIAEVELSTIRRLQQELKALARSITAQVFAERFVANAAITMTAQAEIVFMVSDLYEYMKLEAALIVAQKAKVSTCKHCGDLFVVGGESASRSDRKWCSPRCRVAAFRSRQLSSRA